MIPARRRFLILLAILPVVLLTTTMLYMVGMEHLEANPRDFWASLAWAAETITTTGYGADGRWEHPVMVIFIVLVQFFGVVLIYMVVPLYLIPVLEERFEQRLPQQAPKLRQHVVIFRYGPAVESLLSELENAGVDTLIVETDEAQARHLIVRKLWVVYGSTIDLALRGARLDTARSLIANGSDEENASAILLARQLEFTGEILALVEEPFLRQPMSLAGANAVYTPRHLVATALAARARTLRIQPRIVDVQQLGRHLEVTEIRIEPDSPIAGETLAETHLGAEHGITVIAQWIAGRLQTKITAHMRLEPRGILVVIGRPEDLERFAELAGGPGFHSRSGPFVIAGCGIVGSKIRQLLTDVGEDVVAIDRQGDVNITGDILEPEVLERAQPKKARAIILALDSDSATLFATVVLREQAPNVPIIARVNEAHNVERIHRAGADFALSFSQVSGQILARHLLGQEAVSVDEHLKVQRFRAPAALIGHPAATLGIRERTGCSVVAVERDDDVRIDLGPDFVFERDDEVYVCGSPEGTRRFTEAFS